MNENTSISAGFAASCTGMENDLGNRRSIRLSYGGNGRNPRVLRVSGQCGTRGKRDGIRFVSAQWWAQSVHWAFSSRANFSSTASRMNFGRPYVPAILSTRSSVSGANRIGTGFRCRGGRPIRGALSGAVALFKKTILFSVDGLNDAVYINGIVYGGKTEMTDAELARRYPWSQYPRDSQPGFMSPTESTTWAKEHWPFTVRWTVPDPSPGLYGWRCESRSFLTEDAATAAAMAPMGVARSVEALRWNWDISAAHSDRARQIYRRTNTKYAKKRKAA